MRFKQRNWSIDQQTCNGKNNMNMRKYEKATMMVIEHDSAKRLRLNVDASESHLGISQDILTYIDCVKRKT
jgi:hypothetical protein